MTHVAILSIYGGHNDVNSFILLTQLCSQPYIRGSKHNDVLRSWYICHISVYGLNRSKVIKVLYGHKTVPHHIGKSS